MDGKDALAFHHEINQGYSDTELYVAETKRSSLKVEKNYGAHISLISEEMSLS